MKILYISTLFPKLSNNSTIYTDLAEELVKKGHEVTVVAATDKKVIDRTQFTMERGCRVLRVKVGSLYNVGFIEKGISVVALPHLLNRAIYKYLQSENFDLILFESPPLTLSTVVRLSKKLFRAPAFLMLKDIFPQNAVDIGILSRRSPIYHLFKKQENQLYVVADKIGCMSEANLKYIQDHNNISSDKLCLFPNTKRITTSFDQIIVSRESLNLPKDKTIFLFGGNMGKPQGIPFLSKAIQFSEKNTDAFFLLVGRGSEKDYLKEELKHSTNVKILDELTREEYDSLLGLCDVGIISLDYRFTIPNYPSRILSYMDYSLPVLAVLDSTTDFSQLIDEANCGYWCLSDSLTDFYDKIEKFCYDEGGRVQLGKNGRQYMERNFGVEKSVEILERIFLDR
ncbi:glycosyltransferase family 4 protein [Streptococcus sp. S784/96/1]|uniref:glycosyltransferase family 4 protein n=1 Tax=Streptococcus sp. S784/96/1 TaxID=2653499 RepID=UPI0013865F69|nr:glycosyltransferase family 4 protein [Streptococcus sp. S784/96/1]